MTSDQPRPPVDDAGRRPTMRNDLSGIVHGNVVQGRDVNGGVHFHNNYYAMSAPSLPAAVSARRRRRRWPRAVGEWLLSFGPLTLVSLVPGGIALGVAGDDSVGARLAGLVIGLAVVGAAGMVWWLATRGRSGLTRDMFALWAADRLAFRRLGTVGRPALACFMVCGVTGMIFAIVEQPQLGADGSVQHPAYGTIFFALVALVAAGRLRRRA